MNAIVVTFFDYEADSNKLKEKKKINEKLTKSQQQKTEEYINNMKRPKMSKRNPMFYSDIGGVEYAATLQL